MDALGDRTRRAIFEQLREGPMAVGEIADELPVSRPAVSQHLRVLKEAGLVTERRNGTRRIYRLDPDGLGELRDYFDDFWSEALAAFKAMAEDERRTDEHAGNGDGGDQALRHGGLPGGARVRDVHRADPRVVAAGEALDRHGRDGLPADDA